MKKQKTISVLSPKQFFGMLDEHQTIWFLAQEQRHRRVSVESQLEPLVGTHERQSVAFYIQIDMNGGVLRHFCCDFSYWWDFERQAFERRLEGVLEFESKESMVIVMKAEQLLYEEANESY